MTICYLDLPLDPEAHGVRAVLTPHGRAASAKGRNRDHGRNLDAYQHAVSLAAHTWVDDRNGDWPHYDDPIFLGALFWLRRPTTYRPAEMWHRTRQGGPRRWGGGAGGDTTTLLRAAEDALKGALYRDDGQVSLHLAGKPLVDRSQAQHVELWVTSVDHALQAIADMLARLPIRQEPTGLSGHPVEHAVQPSVISEARSSGARSIPTLSSPPFGSTLPAGSSGLGEG